MTSADMNTREFDRDSYLERIKHSGTISTTVETLASIQESQLRSIPFENFDICLDRAIDVTPSAIVNKLVNKKRGGYCFELNGLGLKACCL